MTLSFDPNSLDLLRRHFIGGRSYSDGAHIEITRPSDGRLYTSCPIADAEMVDYAIQSAIIAQQTSGWAVSSPRDRTKALHRWADLIEENAMELSRIEAATSTRPISQVCAHDTPTSIEQIRFFAEFADKEGGDVIPTQAGSLGMVLTEPYGVVAVITPWNFPLSMAVWKIAPALAAGNAVVIKPSEFTPFSTLYIAELAVRAGIPAGLLNVVLGDGPTTGVALTGHLGIEKVSFTGSTPVGKTIMQNVAQSRVRPLTLELGGKSPQIVFADADLEYAAACVSKGILTNAGQACVAGSRLLVQAQIAEPLIKATRDHMRHVTSGLTWDSTTTYSPIISEKQLSRIESIVDSTIAGGARLICGGERFAGPGFFYQPTMLENVTQNSPAVIDEIFGPVLTVQTFDTEEEAVSLANDSEYGLSVGLFTKDLSRSLRVTKRLHTGTVWVNRYGRSQDHMMPTGGYKGSGIGKDLGRDAYVANLRRKSVLFDI